VIRVPVGALTPEDAAPLLTERERAVLAAFPAEKRRREWLAGTLAAKAAVRERLGPIPWLQMEVLNGPDKDRLVTVPAGLPPVGVTLTHAAGIAVAEAFDPRVERVGIDVDEVAERAPAFLEEAFTAAERAEIGASPARATAAWCLKEAVLKALGVGLSVPLHSVQVSLGPPPQATLSGEAEARRLHIGGTALSVSVQQLPEGILAVARLQMGLP